MKDYQWSLKKLPRPKKDKILPSLLSKEDVARLINAAPNYKYQVFLTFLYATGTRLNEAYHVKLEDIDSDRMQIRISQGKGGKDRYVLLPDRLLKLLREYFVIYRPKVYLFNGRLIGSAYSASAGQWTIRRARDLAGIHKKCSIHTLRNCYATHHLELGTDLVFLQEQMGHKHLKTTAKYIRLCIERYRHNSCRVTRYQSPSGCDKAPISTCPNPLGDIFREYGETYIQQYNPPVQHIKLIRAMRVCKSPAMGGKKYVCKNCNHSHYVYFGCGNSRCSICQSVKRVQWVNKLHGELLDVPYVHLITTMPHQLNSLSRAYPFIMYNILFRTTRDTVFELSNKPDNLAAKPGLISILHTFGSDMKYHVHIHSLMTFGGIDGEGQWQYPKRKKRLCPHVDFRNTFRKNFIALVYKYQATGQLILEDRHIASIEELKVRKWSFFVTKPTMSTDSIELYLARYINRIAVTNSRLTYLKETKEVRLVHNDYNNQIKGKPAPKKTNIIDPLLFVNQYMMHVLPPYFQKSRRYGIHASACKKKYSQAIASKLRSNARTIRTVMEIITELLKVPTLQCVKCKHDQFDIALVAPDKTYINTFLTIPRNRAP